MARKPETLTRKIINFFSANSRSRSGSSASGRSGLQQTNQKPSTQSYKEKLILAGLIALLILGVALLAFAFLASHGVLPVAIVSTLGLAVTIGGVSMKTIFFAVGGGFVVTALFGQKGLDKVNKFFSWLKNISARKKEQASTSQPVDIVFTDALVPEANHQNNKLKIGTGNKANDNLLESPSLPITPDSDLQGNTNTLARHPRCANSNGQLNQANMFATGKQKDEEEIFLYPEYVENAPSP